MFDPNPKLVLVNNFGEETVNYVAPGSEIPASFKSTLIVLTAAQVIALNATPIDVLAAVTGKTIQVMAAILTYTRVANFTVGSSKVLQLKYKTSGQLISSVGDTGFLDQSTSQEAVLFGNGAGGVAIRGKAIQITSDDASIAAGTGSTLGVQLFYNILD
jgi:hypothetical protein